MNEVPSEMHYVKLLTLLTLLTVGTLLGLKYVWANVEHYIIKWDCMQFFSFFYPLKLGKDTYVWWRSTKWNMPEPKGLRNTCWGCGSTASSQLWRVVLCDKGDMVHPRFRKIRRGAALNGAVNVEELGGRENLRSIWSSSQKNSIHWLICKGLIYLSYGIWKTVLISIIWWAVKL